MSNPTSIRYLPDEMIESIATFLDIPSLKSFMVANHKIHRGCSVHFGDRVWYRAGRNYFRANVSRSPFRTVIHHLTIGFDWSFYHHPLTALAEAYDKRGQEIKYLKSIKIGLHILQPVDCAYFFGAATDLKLIVFGMGEVPTNNLKTVMFDTSADISPAVPFLTGIQRIIVTSGGMFAEDFISMLQGIISRNRDTLTEMNLQGPSQIDIPKEILEGLELRKLYTLSDDTSLVTELGNMTTLRSLKCGVTGHQGFWRSMPNIQSLTININVEDYNLRVIRNFFPNLTSLTLFTSTRQRILYGEDRTSLPHLKHISGRYNGTMILGNIIAANLEEVELAPANIRIISHLGRHSPMIKKMTVKDNLDSERTITSIITVLEQFGRIRLLTLRHDSVMCTCNLLDLAIELFNFTEKLQSSPQIEIFVELEQKYKKRTAMLFRAFHCSELLDLGENMQIIVSKNIRILAKFRRFWSVRHDLGNHF